MPLPPTCPRIDYDELDYLTQVDDRERVEQIGDRLESVGIPACVQTVTVRAESRRTNNTYRIFVPADQVELARWVVFEEPAYIDGQVTSTAEQIASISSHGHPLAADQIASEDRIGDER